MKLDVSPLDRSFACRSLVLVALVVCFLAATDAAPPVRLEAQDFSDLRLNQIQVIGTHNSYHRAPSPGLQRWLAVAGQANGQAFDYSHVPLAEQFGRLKIRQIELDVFADPRGGHYASPFFYRMMREQNQDAGPDPNAGGQLDQPGLKVLHVQDIDYVSTTPTFKIALRQVRDWSRANPRHAPILILVELKDEVHALLPTKPIPFTREQIEVVDREILEVFERADLFLPDDLRREAETLPTAIAKHGWPTVGELRGKVLFALDNEDAIRDRYLEGNPILRNRVMFTSVAEGHPAAAWFKVNDAVRDFDRIQRLVRAGFVVRTRADNGTQEARRNDVARRDRAFASGAQWISTDYPEPRREWSDYQVQWEGAAELRVNPVTSSAKTPGR